MIAILSLLWQNKRIVADALIALAIIAGLAWIRHHLIMQGYAAGSAHVQSQWDTEKHAQMMALDAANKRESQIAVNLEARLAKFKAEQRVIDHETIKLVERPVYRNVCLDADGVRSINASAGASIDPAVTPAKPATEVPPSPSSSGRDWDGRAFNHAGLGQHVPRMR